MRDVEPQARVAANGEAVEQPDPAPSATATDGPANLANPFGTFRRQALAQQIVGRVLELVRGRHLRPGDQLPAERDLAAMMEVSRASLREALRALTVMGVLEMRHGRGTYVSSLEPEVLVRQLGLAFSLNEAIFDQVFEARLAVEPQIARLAATKVDGAIADELRSCLERAEQAMADRERFLRLDMELHGLIGQTAGNAILTQFMESIAIAGLASRRKTVSMPGQPARTMDDHRRIVAALLSADPDAAEVAMRDHLERLRAEQHEQPHQATSDDRIDTDSQTA